MGSSSSSLPPSTGSPTLPSTSSSPSSMGSSSSSLKASYAHVNGKRDLAAAALDGEPTAAHDGNLYLAANIPHRSDEPRDDAKETGRKEGKGGGEADVLTSEVADGIPGRCKYILGYEIDSRGNRREYDRA
nr:unnamed protein product [Digitaria exilis]